MTGTDTSGDSAESDTTRLRNRARKLGDPVGVVRSGVDSVRQAPRATKVWVAGALILLALELGHYLRGFHRFGTQTDFVIDLLFGIPDFVGDNFATAFDFVFASVIAEFVGAIVHDATTVVLLFVVATMLYWWVMPVRILDYLSFDSTRRRENYIERGIITGVLTLLYGLVVFTPFSEIFHGEIGLYASTVDQLATDLPTLTSPDTIPNEGYRSPDGGWEGTFMGLRPGQAWAIRTALVFVYAFVGLFWLLKGYDVYREHYRDADWTPRDDTLKRFRNHYWGMFGFAMVFIFVVMGAWAPAVSPTDIHQNVYEPWTDDSTFEYLNEDGEVDEIPHGLANIDTESDGQQTVGPNSYDRYDRYHPAGTTSRGQDLFTMLAYGARTSLIIGLVAIGLGSLIAVVLSLVTAYYKGLIDIITILASDTIISIPAFLLVMMLSVIFRAADHPITEPLDGGFLLALVLAFAYWPGLWRTIRGPSLQVAEEEWVDAAKSYGQAPSAIMRKHMAPYVAGYMMIYASLLLGAAIIVTAALSFLGLGINHPTPEWGRIINNGREYIATPSWHISTISGILIVLVVLGFNALGDGIRDAIDPEADTGGHQAAGGGG